MRSLRSPPFLSPVSTSSFCSPSLSFDLGSVLPAYAVVQLYYHCVAQHE